MKTNFKVGDWIIATKPMMVERMDSFSVIGSSMKPDRAYMHNPLEVAAITEGHIVYQYTGFDGGVSKNILPLCEVVERGFIVAAPELVEAARV